MNDVDRLITELRSRGHNIDNGMAEAIRDICAAPQPGSRAQRGSDDSTAKQAEKKVEKIEKAKTE